MLTILGQFMLAAALAAALWFQTQRLHTVTAERDSAVTKLKVANNSTLDALAAAKTEHGVVQRLLGLAQARKEAGARALAGLAGREREDQAASDRLRASAASTRAPDAPCVISDALAKTPGL